jgi:hypothetical protein
MPNEHDRRMAEFEQEFRHHEQSLGSKIGNAGRRLIGKIKHLVRNPENHARADAPIGQDVGEPLSVSREVDAPSPDPNDRQDLH